MPNNSDFSSLRSPNDGLREKRKSGIHTSSIIIVQFKSRWCIFRELIRAANVCDWCAPVIWILTGWPTYYICEQTLTKSRQKLERRGIAMKKRGKKERKKGRREIEKQHRRERAGLDSQLQIRRNMERRIIPRSRLSWPVFEVKDYWGVEISKTCALCLPRAFEISQAFDLRSVYMCMCLYVYSYYEVMRLSITMKVILFSYTIPLLEKIFFYAFLFLWRKNINFIAVSTNSILKTVLNVLY